jgi:hypothetical protein
MSDLLGDQRAKDLLAADPGVVSQLVAAFRVVAAQAQSTGDELRGVGGQANWTGSAADAFRQGLGKLPGDLDKVNSSYEEAANGLDAFEVELSSLQPKLKSILAQIQSAQSGLANAQSQLSSAQTALSTAQSQALTKSITTPMAPLVTVPASSPLHTAVDAASGAISNAQNEIASLTQQGFALLDEFASSRGTAQGKVASASHVPPHPSFWDSVFGGVGNFLAGLGKGILDVGKFILHPLLDLPSAIGNFIAHPGWKSFGELAEDVAGTALIVATIVAPFAGAELLAADASEEAAAAGVEGATEAGTEAAGRATELQNLVKNANLTAKWAGRAGGASTAISDIEDGDYVPAVMEAATPWIPDTSNLLGIGDKGIESSEGVATAWGNLEKQVNDLPDSSIVKAALGDIPTLGKETAEQMAQVAKLNLDLGGQQIDYASEQLKRVVK